MSNEDFERSLELGMADADLDTALRLEHCTPLARRVWCVASTVIGRTGGDVPTSDLVERLKDLPAEEVVAATTELFMKKLVDLTPSPYANCAPRVSQAGFWGPRVSLLVGGPSGSTAWPWWTVRGF